MEQTTKRTQWIRFTLFSGSAAVIQLIVFAALFEWLTRPYWISYILSLLALVFWNTFWNRKFTFRSTVKFRIAIYKLVVFYLFFIPIFTWIGDGLIRHGWDEYLVLILTMICNLVLAFFYNKHVIYKT